MVVFPVHILANPLVLVLAAFDGYVLTAALYLITNRFTRGGHVRWHPVLGRIITAPAQFMEKRLVLWRSRPVPAWQPWTVVFVTALIVRQLVAVLIVSTS